MNENKMLMGMRNMKDIVKAERARAIGQNNFTNMDNIHTYTICHPDLVIARVFLMHGEGFKFTGDMISASPPLESRYQFGSKGEDDAIDAMQL
jgi:hypothetical protein